MGDQLLTVLPVDDCYGHRFSEAPGTCPRSCAGLRLTAVPLRGDSPARVSYNLCREAEARSGRKSCHTGSMPGTSPERLNGNFLDGMKRVSGDWYVFVQLRFGVKARLIALGVARRVLLECAARLCSIRRDGQQSERDGLAVVESQASCASRRSHVRSTAYHGMALR